MVLAFDMFTIVLPSCWDADALIQIVDGEGNPTDFYEDYLSYARTSTPEFDEDFAGGDIPRNYPLYNGSYIALMGRLAGAPSPSPPPIPPFLPGICTNGCNYPSDGECDECATPTHSPASVFSLDPQSSVDRILIFPSHRLWESSDLRLSTCSHCAPLSSSYTPSVTHPFTFAARAHMR